MITSLLMAGAAYGTHKVSYSGKTSQHQSISFSISSGKLSGLSVWIEIHCPAPAHHTYRLRAHGFTAIPVTHGAFAQKFTSTDRKSSFTLKGQVGRKSVTGSVALRDFVSGEHHFCSAKASFTAKPRK